MRTRDGMSLFVFLLGIFVGLCTAMVVSVSFVNLLPGIAAHVVGASLGGCTAGAIIERKRWAIVGGLLVGVLLIAIVNLILYAIMQQGGIHVSLVTPTAVKQCLLLLIASGGCAAIGAVLRGYNRKCTLD